MRAERARRARPGIKIGVGMGDEREVILLLEGNGVSGRRPGFTFRLLMECFPCMMLTNTCSHGM